MFCSVTVTANTSTLSPHEMGLLILLTGIVDLTRIASPLFEFSKGVVYTLYPFNLNLCPVLRRVSCSSIISYLSALQ